MKKSGFWENPALRSRIRSANVKLPEMLLGYLLGPVGGLLTSQIFVVYLNFYWTDVLAMNSTAASAFLSVMPLVSVAFTVVGSLLAGIILDKTSTAQGRARPYILAAAPLVSILAVLMFAVPAGNEPVQFVWIAVTYNLYYGLAFPLYNTANQMTLPLSTRNGKQRGQLSVFNGISLTAASSFATLVLPVIVPAFGLDRHIWLGAMCVFGGVSLVCILLQYYFTRERVTEETMKLGIRQEKVSVAKQLSAVAKEKYWWMIILFYLVFLLVGNMQNFSMIYYCNYILGTYQDGFTQSVLGIVTGIPLALGMAVVWPIAKRFGKKNSTLVGLLISAAGCLVAFLAPRSWFWVCAGLFIKCLGAAPANYVMMALFADVLDHIEAKYGFRCDGFSLSLRSIMMAVVLSVCQGIFNAMVGVSGYVAPAASRSGIANEVMKQLKDGTCVFVQNEATQQVFIWCYIGFMLVGYVVCALILFRLNVEKCVDEDHCLIRERQKAAVLAAGGEWIDPEVRLQQEQEEADQLAEIARIEELKATCAKRGLDFDVEEAKYQTRLAAQRAKAKKK